MKTKKKPAGKIKTAISLDPDTYKRLAACSAGEDMTQSEVLSTLIDRYLASYHVRGSGLLQCAHSSNSVEKNISPATTSEDQAYFNGATRLP
jgi:hypothetical protein